MIVIMIMIMIMIIIIIINLFFYLKIKIELTWCEKHETKKERNSEWKTQRLMMLHGVGTCQSQQWNLKFKTFFFFFFFQNKIQIGKPAFPVETSKSHR